MEPIIIKVNDEACTKLFKLETEYKTIHGTVTGLEKVLRDKGDEFNNLISVLLPNDIPDEHRIELDYGKKTIKVLPAENNKTKDS